MRFEVSTTQGIEVAAIVPSSGMLIWKSDSTSEKIGLELLVRAVDLVDQQHRGLLAWIALSSGRSSRKSRWKMWASLASAERFSLSRILIASSWR